jgi:hypothetical protein
MRSSVSPTLLCTFESTKINMEENVVLIFGAGATRASGRPLTNQILPEAFRDISDRPSLQTTACSVSQMID